MRRRPTDTSSDSAGSARRHRSKRRFEIALALAWTLPLLAEEHYGRFRTLGR